MKKFILSFLFISPACLFAQQQGTSKSQKIVAFPPPLYVIDGKILSDKGKVGPDSTQLVSPIESINPNDIDKIEVLSGSSAIEKYGEAGKNGVVIIQTKPKSPKKN